MKNFDTLDEAYRGLFDVLLAIANRHIYNRDYAVDAVHNAFTKAAENIAKKPTNRVSGFLLARETVRACRRLNKYSVEVPSGTIGEDNDRED